MGQSNKHTGSSFDEWLEEENLLEEIGELSKVDIEFLEELSKSCPRCGKPSKNKSNPNGRCASCLKKLASNKKKPGHYLHNHKVADDALRRQKGKNGTASKKSKGLGTRKEIIDKVKSAERKTGQVLSPDRKDNSKGYSSSNVRMVPKHLNRGRHNVDPKKLANWRKKVKKHDLDVDSFRTLLIARAYENNNEELAKALTYLYPDVILDLFDN
jgi:hypothetical protein